MIEAELYLYAGCTSCRNAESVLKANGAQVARREFFKDPLSPAEITALFARVRTTPRAMLSTRSRPYQELGLAGRELSDNEIVQLMSEHPALIRRPIVVVGDQALVGFNRGSMERLLVEKEQEGNGHA